MYSVIALLYRVRYNALQQIMSTSPSVLLPTGHVLRLYKFRHQRRADCRKYLSKFSDSVIITHH